MYLYVTREKNIYEDSIWIYMLLFETWRVLFIYLSVGIIPFTVGSFQGTKPLKAVIAKQRLNKHLHQNIYIIILYTTIPSRSQQLPKAWWIQS